MTKKKSYVGTYLSLFESRYFLVSDGITVDVLKSCRRGACFKGEFLAQGVST